MKLEYIPCDLCGSTDHDIIFQQRDLLTNIDIQFNEVRCRECGLVFINPRPPMEEIGQFYTAEFVSYQFDVFNDSASLREKLVSYVTKSNANSRIKKIRKMLDLRPGSTVLDIGCGRGGFLHGMKESLGCEVMGVDFDHDSVAYCRNQLGLDVHQGSMNALDRIDTKFDLVTAWHFLEHEFAPSLAVKRMAGLVKEGGHMMIEVPNQESLENHEVK